jgi:hypothetical protein
LPRSIAIWTSYLHMIFAKRNTSSEARGAGVPVPVQRYDNLPNVFALNKL